MPKVPYHYEVNGKLVTGNGSLILICSLSNRSLLPSLTVQPLFREARNPDFFPVYCLLFEKICSIKSCHFSNHGILIERKIPDCFFNFSLAEQEACL